MRVIIRPGPNPKKIFTSWLHAIIVDEYIIKPKIIPFLFHRFFGIPDVSVPGPVLLSDFDVLPSELSVVL